MYYYVCISGLCNQLCSQYYGPPIETFYNVYNAFEPYHWHLVPKTMFRNSIEFKYTDKKGRSFSSFIESFPCRILRNYKLCDIMEGDDNSSFFALNGCWYPFRRKMEKRRGYSEDNGQCDILFARKVIPYLFLEIPKNKDPEEVSLYLNKLIVCCVFIIGAKKNFRKLNVYLQGASTIYGIDLDANTVLHVVIQLEQPRLIQVNTFILPLSRKELKDSENQELPTICDFKENLKTYINKFQNNTELDKKVYKNEFCELKCQFVKDAYDTAKKYGFHEKALGYYICAYLSNKEWYIDWIRNKYT